MSLIKILRDSFHLLINEPKIFVPRFVTTALYSIYLVLLAGLALDVYQVMDSIEVIPPHEAGDVVFPLLGDALVLLLFAIFLLFLDLITYAMYPRLVDDYHCGNPISLIAALKDALKAWKLLFILWLAILILSMILYPVVFISEFITTQTGSWIPYLIAAVLVITVILAVAVLLFFVVPVAVIEKEGVINAFKKGFAMSTRHRSELLKINILFFILVSISMALCMLAEFRGLVAVSALLLFIVVRFIQAVVYAYISVVSPYFYLIRR